LRGVAGGGSFGGAPKWVPLSGPETGGPKCEAPLSGFTVWSAGSGTGKWDRNGAHNRSPFWPRARPAGLVAGVAGPNGRAASGAGGGRRRSPLVARRTGGGCRAAAPERGREAPAPRGAERCGRRRGLSDSGRLAGAALRATAAGQPSFSGGKLAIGPAGAREGPRASAARPAPAAGGGWRRRPPASRRFRERERTGALAAARRAEGAATLAGPVGPWDGALSGRKGIS